MSETTNQIFEGYRSVGLISSSVPHIVRYVQKINQIRIITASHKSFLVFNRKLKLLEACVAHSSDINVLASSSKFMFTAADNEIFGWKHGHRWKTKSFDGCGQTVTHLMPFGIHLIAIDSANVLNVWQMDNEELTLTIPFDPKSFEITCLLHPATYLNKILMGSAQGSLQLLNIRTQQIVYQFKGWNSKVTQLTQAPAVDIVAIGLQSGVIVLHHLKQDESVMKFRQEWGPVLSLSFRSDGPPILVSSSPDGCLAVWNLERKRLEAQMMHIHDGPIVGCHFINREPLLVTNSADNSLKVWCFDQSDSCGRLLYERQAHHKPPTKIRFHGRNGHYILSAGLDASFRCFHMYSERMNRSMGTASYNRKLAKKKGVNRDPNKMQPIIDFTTEVTREKEWDGIAACHRKSKVVTTWSFDKMKMGEHKLLHQRFRGQRNITAHCCCMSSCGNFVTIGYNTGHIDRFNVQSGIYRATYGQPTAHNGAVRGIASDSLNHMVVSGGFDRNLKFWRFKSKDLLSSLTLEAPIDHLLFHKENSLLAVSLANHYVNIVDCEMRRVIRIFGAHDNRITDMTFNSDGRWLITSCMDSIIRVWDLPLGRVINAFRVSNPCVSLSLSPNGQYLATAHLNDLGIYIWSNISVYNPLTLLPLEDDYEPPLIELPRVLSEVEEENEDDIEIIEDSVEEVMDINLDYKSPEQISKELITISLLPESRWKNLLNLDIIKKRNKPKEPVKKPQNAPFFLPTISGLQPQFAIEDKRNDSELSSDNTHIIKFTSISTFGELLIECGKSYNFSPVIDQLKSMGPSMIDAEIRSLSHQVCGTHDLLLHFMDAILQRLETNRDYELMQSYLGVFLKIHTEEIAGSKELLDKCEQMSELVESSWDRLSHQFNKSISIINYIRSAVL